MPSSGAGFCCYISADLAQPRRSRGKPNSRSEKTPLCGSWNLGTATSTLTWKEGLATKMGWSCASEGQQYLITNAWSQAPWQCSWSTDSFLETSHQLGLHQVILCFVEFVHQSFSLLQCLQCMKQSEIIGTWWFSAFFAVSWLRFAFWQRAKIIIVPLKCSKKYYAAYNSNI